MSGMLLNDLNGTQTYNIGDKVEFLFQVDAATALLIGPTMPVSISDAYGNPIVSFDAEQLGTIYVVEWTIPFNIGSLYDLAKVETTPSDRFYLVDTWDVVGTPVSCNFSVLKRLESPTEDNSEITVQLCDVEALDRTKLESTIIKFTTKMNPFYCSVKDVVDIYPEYLSTVDVFNIAKNIYDHSINLDLHMRPDHITYQARFSNAARNYVAYEVAENILSADVFNVSDETKQLDTFKVSKEYNYNKGVARIIREHLELYGNIVLAGGEDTPYISKRFVKGIFDPNRPMTSRSNNFIGIMNSTFNTIVQTKDNSTIEIRGNRTIAYSSWQVSNNPWRLETWL